MATERLRVILEMAAGQYKREAREAATATGSIGQQAKTATRATSGLETRMSGLGSVLRGAAVAGGIAALGRGLFTAVEAAEQSASALANTEQIISQTGGAANVTSDDIVTLSRRLSGLTGVQDEVVQEGANVLLTFKNIKNEAGEGNDVFDRTAALMLDISAVMGTDASSAALQLGKALNDPVANMGALSRAGLTFSQTQKDQIKDLVANNQLLEAQGIILSELESQLGGTAAASADATDKIANAFGEIAEAIGAKALPFVEAFATNLQASLDLITELDRVALLSGGDPASLESFTTSVAVIAGLAGPLNEAGAGISSFFEMVEGQGSRVTNQLTALVDAASPEQLRAFADFGLSYLVDEMGLSADQAQILADLIERRLTAEFLELTPAEKRARDELERFNDATGEVGDVDLDGIDEAFVNTRLSVEEARKAVEIYENAVRRVTDPVFRALDDQDRLTEAIARYNEVSSDTQASSGDVERAWFDVAEAQLAAEQSARDLPDSIDGASQAIERAGERAGIANPPLEDIADTWERLKAAQGQARLELFIDFLATANYGPGARAAFERASSGTVDIGNIRHGGGPGRQGQPYLIRPGDEIFVPSGSGQFLLNDQVISALRGMSKPSTSTHHYNIPIQSTGSSAVDAQLVGSVASVLRRMETL